MILTRAQQRAKDTQSTMTSVQLECHLHNLIRDILTGDTSKLVEFQQFIQYTPPATKTRLLNQLEF